MWCLVTSRGQRVALRTLPAVLGSEGDADVVLRHPSIAGRHARVAEDGDGLALTALDGAHLEVDGAACEQGRLRHGGRVVLGAVALTAVDTDAATPAPDDGPADAPSAPATDGDGDGDGGELTLRRAPASAPPGPTGSGSRARGGTPGGTGGRTGAGRSASGSRAARGERLETRGARPLSFQRQPARKGLAHADLSQLTGTPKLLAVLAVLVAGAVVVWLVQTAVGLMP